jgi:hypothetical protein
MEYWFRPFHPTWLGHPPKVSFTGNIFELSLTSLNKPPAIRDAQSDPIGSGRRSPVPSEPIPIPYIRRFRTFSLKKSHPAIGIPHLWKLPCYPDVVNPERYFPRPGLGSAKELHGQTLQICGVQHLFCSACLVGAQRGADMTGL